MSRKGEIIEMVLKTFWEKTVRENPDLNVKDRQKARDCHYGTYYQITHQ